MQGGASWSDGAADDAAGSWRRSILSKNDRELRRRGARRGRGGGDGRARRMAGPARTRARARASRARATAHDQGGVALVDLAGSQTGIPSGSGRRGPRWTAAKRSSGRCGRRRRSVAVGVVRGTRYWREGRSLEGGRKVRPNRGGAKLSQVRH